MPSAPPLSLEDEERTLVADALNGEGQAFTRLVRPHLQMMYRVAKRTESSATVAEDAVQEALLIANERLKDYRVGSNLKAWLAAIVIRRSRTLGRAERRRRLREREGLSLITSQDTPHTSAEGEVLRTQIIDILTQMPVRRREAVILRLDAGLSHREIAEQLNSTEASVRVLLHLGLKTLRERLAHPKEDQND